MGEGQGALQPGGRAPAVLRKRVEREEQGGGVKRRGIWVVLARLG